MPLVPPELTLPFASSAERVEARRRLVERDRALRAIEAIAKKPAEDWTAAELAAFPEVTNGVTDPQPQRVARWASLFAEELREVHRLTVRHPPLGDVELQEALYLAGRLIATVTDRPIDTIDGFSLAS